VFRPKDKSSVRQRLNLGEHDKVLLFIADNVRNIRKGFDLLLEALQQLHTAQIVLLALGDDQGKTLHTGSVRYAGRVNDDELMADYFNAADAFVLPSREDNLPNVMLEAFACGCPVIGFPVGGIQEHVIAGKTGVLANEVSGPALATAIDNFFTTHQSFSRADIRTYAEENFNRKVQVAAYRSVIEEMMN
jgi:glycosyltransferase involved in cell wall biosynthesis